MKKIPTTKRIEKDLNDLLKNYDIDKIKFEEIKWEPKEQNLLES